MIIRVDVSKTGVRNTVDLTFAARAYKNITSFVTIINSSTTEIRISFFSRVMLRKCRTNFL